MKNCLFLLVVIIIASLFTSCNKEEEIEPGIIITDNPPVAIFAQAEGYGQTNFYWLTKETFQNEKNLGKQEVWYENNDYPSFNEWHLLPIRKYWGILNGVIYISSSIDWVYVQSYFYNQLVNKIDDKGTIIVYCDNDETPDGKKLTVVGYGGW